MGTQILMGMNLNGGLASAQAQLLSELPALKISLSLCTKEFVINFVFDNTDYSLLRLTHSERSGL